MQKEHFEDIAIPFFEDNTTRKNKRISESVKYVQRKGSLYDDGKQNKHNFESLI